MLIEHLQLNLIIMPLFDFLKRVLGWVDERSRKRRSDSSSPEPVFVSSKKHKPDYNSVGTNEFTIDDDSDNDEVQVTAHMFSPTTPHNKLNGGHCGINKSHECSRVQPQSSTFTPAVLRRNDNLPKTCINDTCSTLARTHRLKERNQYGELLQNFLPRRIHVLHSKHEQTKPNENTPEIIVLDKSDLTEASCNDQKKLQKMQIRQDAKFTGTTHSFHSQYGADAVQHGSKKEAEKSMSVGYFKRNSMDSTHSKVQTDETNMTAIQTIASNTLRDILATKAVVRGDFIPQISKRYDERIEQRCKEAEELKRMTCLLSKRNRLTREAVLEEQLARSMRLCAVVLDEREESEDAQLPTLTESMLKEVRDALVPRPADEVLVEGFGLRITRKDINTLSDLNWLNDEVINFYMNLLIARSASNNKYPKVHAMNTFFYPKLITGGHSSLKRWTRKIDIFNQDIVVIPVHLGIHWCMSIIDFRDKSIRYYDSMGSSNNKCLAALRQYLHDESLDKKKAPYDTSDWSLECAKNIPQQMNGSDCGVFSCMFAEYICANRNITFTQDDMAYFRNKMVYEILKSKLL